MFPADKTGLVPLSLTVAIPCYNAAAFIGETIASLLAQTHPADEILVVDDGSTDESAAIIRRYPVRLVSHPTNRGLAQARNTAMAHAGSDLLLFVDADALADRELIATLLAAGYDDPAVAGVGGQGIEANIATTADRWRRAHATQGHGPRPRPVDHLYGLCMSYRLNALVEVGGFNPSFRTNAEDVDLGLRLRAAGYRLLYQPRARVYHQRSDSADSLKRTIATWYAAGYRAKKLNNARPWTLFTGSLRRLLADPLHDLLVERDLRLAQLSWQMGWIKLRALRQAAAED